jgi:hypothetical protein
MKNCVTEMMSERRRCHYYARGKTWHEEAFNVRHMVFNNVSHIFFSIGQPIKKCYKCAHYNFYVCKIRVSACVLEASLLET